MGKKLPPLIFPNYIGPSSRNTTTALLYHGKLSVSLPGWLSPGVVITFQKVLEYVEHQSHEFKEFFYVIAHFFELAQKHAEKEIYNFEPLGKRVTKIFTVYSGTDEAFRSLESSHDPCLYLAAQELQNPISMCTASVEFLWRLWEIALESGSDPNDPESVDPKHIIKYLEKRVSILGSLELVLAESSLNRYYAPKTGGTAFVVDSLNAVTILSVIGQKIINDDEDDDEDNMSVSSELLSFYFFDQILSKWTKPLNGEYVSKVNELFDKRQEALASLKEKCKINALNLCDHSSKPKVNPKLVEHTLRNMLEEATEISQTDDKTIRKYFEEISHDSTTWLTIGGFIGSIALLPEIFTASLAMSAFSILGANALKMRTNRKKILKKSDFAFVYHASKAIK